MANRINMVCPHCGQDDVVVNARAQWNKGNQRWELLDTWTDEAFCEACEADLIKIKQIDLHERSDGNLETI